MKRSNYSLKSVNHIPFGKSGIFTSVFVFLSVLKSNRHQNHNPGLTAVLCASVIAAASYIAADPSTRVWGNEITNQCNPCFPLGS